MTRESFDDLRREVGAIPPADADVRERVWRSALVQSAPRGRLARLRRARVLVPVAAAYLLAVPIATAVVVDRSDPQASAQLGSDLRYMDHWQVLGKDCPKPSKDVPLRACVAFARVAGKSTLYLNGIAPEGARRITIRFDDRTTADARIQQGAFLLSVPLAQQLRASDARVTVAGADGSRSRTLALDDLMALPGFGYKVEHDYRSNHPCPPASR
jgi:hypothetical protein